MKNKKLILGLILSLIIILGGCNSAKNAVPADKPSQPAETSQVSPTPSEVNVTVGQTKEEEVKKEPEVSEVQKVTNEQPEAPVEQKSEKAAETTPAQKDVIKIEGSGIKNTVAFGLGEIKKMKEAVVEDDYFSLNNYGTKKYFHFKGVSVWYLLNEKAGITDNAATVCFTADDGYSVTYTLDEIKKEDYIDEQNPAKKYKVIIAWEEDGKEYNSEEGSPFKLVIGQKEPGDINKPNWVQNVSTIKVE